MKKQRGYWTKERCEEEALKYKNRKEFYNNSQSAYVIASRNKWLNEICSHMEWQSKPMYYWTKDRCYKEALKYKSRYDFQIGSAYPYRVSIKNGWIDDICSHMVVLGNLYKRMVYLYLFKNNSVYIGITCDLDRRKNEHLKIDKNSVVNKYIKEIGLKPKYQELSGYIDVEEAIKMEKETIKKYKEKGYNVLNKDSGGGIGNSNSKWVYSNCKKEASKYKNRSEFWRKKRRACKKSKDEGWLDEFFTQ